MRRTRSGSSIVGRLAATSRRLAICVISRQNAENNPASLTQGEYRDENPIRSLCSLGHPVCYGGLGEEGSEPARGEAVDPRQRSTAIWRLISSARCDDPSKSLEINRLAGDFWTRLKGRRRTDRSIPCRPWQRKAIGKLAGPLRRKDSETVIYPDAFDKFYGGELEAFLKDKGAELRSSPARRPTRRCFTPRPPPRACIAQHRDSMTE